MIDIYVVQVIKLLFIKLLQTGSWLMWRKYKIRNMYY